MCFPFTDQRGSKQRPAIVISNANYHQARPDIILMAVTSQIRVKMGFGEAVIENWQAADLLKPSVLDKGFNQLTAELIALDKDIHTYQVPEDIEAIFLIVLGILTSVTHDS